MLGRCLYCSKLLSSRDRAVSGDVQNVRTRGYASVRSGQSLELCQPDMQAEQGVRTSLGELYCRTGCLRFYADDQAQADHQQYDKGHEYQRDH